ncbi:hypothetical protein RB653_002662 [Dictyostelium firmibasis]|uniref:Small ribosomal subunit protein mS41 n=1 Tax=Dictyostelium firmibasis TaxID=79012 RepID=A0AAN7YVT5_9MYCE
MISRLILNSRKINKNVIVPSNLAVTSLFKNNIIYINNRSFCSVDPTSSSEDSTIKKNKKYLDESITGDQISEYTYDEDESEYTDVDRYNFDQYYLDITEDIVDRQLVGDEAEEVDESIDLFEDDEIENFEVGQADEVSEMSDSSSSESTTTKKKTSETPVDNKPIWGVNYRVKEGQEEEDKFAFIQLPTDVPILPTINAPESVEELIINYQDPFKNPSKTNANYSPYFRFTEPRGFTVETFLKKIGRGCNQHVELFEKWEDLMETTPRKLKDAQVPVVNRKWILHWVEQFKQGRDPVLISKSKSKSKSNKKK